MFAAIKAFYQNKYCLSLILGICLVVGVCCLRQSILIRLNGASYGFLYCGNATPSIGNMPGSTEYRTKRNATKLFLFAYMRGGSSIAGELFNCDPSATMWYEPGDAFFSAYYGLSHENLPQNDLYFTNMTRRNLDLKEVDALADFYSNIFSCDYNILPPETMAHYFLEESTAMDEYCACMSWKRTRNVNINACKSHIHSICSSNLVETSLAAKCHVAIAAAKSVITRNPTVKKEAELLTLLQNYLKEQSVQLPHSNYDGLVQFIRHGLCIEQMREDNEKCIKIAEAKCKRDKLIVVQVNRMKMEDMEPLIRANPDIHVVHYTRDPRAIAFSRIKAVLLAFNNDSGILIREAYFICQKMRDDIRQRILLQRTYPGVFTHLTYEDLAVDPVSFARKMYAVFNGTYPTAWITFIAEHMHGYRDSSAFGITVRNATETAYKWKTEIPKEQLDAIKNFCSDVITELGYQL